MNRIFEMKRIATFSLLVSMLAAAPAFAAEKGNIEAGKQKSLPCQACHGADGNSIDPMYPRIAGQYEDYLVRSLKEYRSGKRKNAIMGGFATTLSDQDIADLSAFYSALPGKLADLSKHLSAK
jgi:cytochrome c553